MSAFTRQGQKAVLAVRGTVRRTFGKHDEPTPITTPTDAATTSSARAFVMPDDKVRVLWCLVEGQSTAFKVVASINDDTDGLRNLVKHANTPALDNRAAHTLILWKLNEPVLIKPEETLGRRVQAPGLDPSQFCVRLDASDRVLDIFPEQPSVNYLHILVRIPAEIIAGQKRPADVTSDILCRWSKQPRLGLPSIDELPGLLDSPLSEDEKLPLSNEQFEDLVSALDAKDLCNRSDVEILFRVSESESSQALFLVFYNAALKSAPPVSGSESSFISFWDLNIRDILELLIPNGTSIRDSSAHTSTKKLRPDFGFLLNNVCPFRGEEKAASSRDNPKAELSNKLAWTYDPAPYIFGYHSVGPNLTLAAICPPLAPSRKPYVQDLVSANLRLKRDRIRNLRRMINLARYIQPLLSLIGYRDAPEFTVIDRDDKLMEIGLKSVKKTYLGESGPQRVRYLENIYKALKDKDVPHVDRLVHLVNAAIYLEPKGIAVRPSNEAELLEAITCVLEALVVLHQDPPLFHRDIRWPNIVRKANDRSLWFLIDWEDAAAPNTFAASHLSLETHSPRVAVDNHGGEVDVWGVGRLIAEAATFAYGISSKLLALGKWMEDEEPTSQAALDAVKKYADLST